MYIERRKTRGGETLYIFNFYDEQDRDNWISRLKACAGDEKRELHHLVKTLESRTDSKYVTKEYKLSGMLFESEFVRFAVETMQLMCKYQSEVKYLQNKEK